ncbi:MAG: FKBP-type peptidyl-prolyl cis-trans isomerase [archaeon]
MIKEKDLIEINLILKDNNTKEILDTNIESVAKEGNIFKTNMRYSPLKFVFGKKELLDSVEDNIKDLKIGEEKTFSLKKSQAFGEREDAKIKLMQLSEFKKEKINPLSGMIVNLGGEIGKILSVSGGRVKVDFNSEFAGKDLEYTIKLLKIFSEDLDKAKAITEKYFYFLPLDKIKVNLISNILEIQLPLGLPKEIDYFKQSISHEIFDSTNIENIKFVENFSKKEHLH